MATFTVTTGTPESPVDWAGLGVKTNADLLNVNGGYVLIDSDSRYGLNSAQKASHGSITLSANLGGTVEINSTKIRLIPYTGGSGSVPAADSVISRGGASGKLIGVFPSLTVAASAAGTAMPATGFIKVRQWNGTPYTAGALTGITATGAVDGPGWLELMMADAGILAVNRLNKLLVVGDWYDFQGQLTSGDNNQFFQIPCVAVTDAMAFPGVEVETAVGSGVYEHFPSAGSLPCSDTNIATDRVRGRWCWVGNDGKIRFQRDAGGAGGGYLPPAGLRVRIPNLFMWNTTSNSGNVTVPNLTLTTRYRTNTAGGGYVNLSKCMVAPYLVFLQPYEVKLTDVYTYDSIFISKGATPIDWNRVCVGQSANLTNFALSLTLMTEGGVINDSTWTRYSLGSGAYVATLADSTGFAFNNSRTHAALSRAHANSGMFLMTRLSNCTWNTPTLGGGQTSGITCQNIKFNNPIYYDHPALTTVVASYPAYAFTLSASCSGFALDGFNFGGLTMVQPASGIISVAAAGCTNIRVRNLGTDAVPLDLGAVRQDNSTWTRVTTTVTVTQVAHGLKAGDVIYVPVSSVTAAVAVGSKVLLSTPTPDTFTFAGLNAGATSGTISYFPTVSAYLFSLATGASATDVKFQRCYVPHTRTNLYVADNSSKDVYLDNVISDYLNPFLTPVLDMQIRGTSGTPPLTPQLGVYGFHWFDVFNADVTTNLTGLAWTRVGTLATVVSVDHKLRTGLLINVNASSDTVGVNLGARLVTVIDSDTFTFAVTNSGGLSGTLGMRTVIDRLVLMMNEPSFKTAGQVSDVIGGAAFTSAGGLAMPTVGDSITIEQPGFFLSPTGFPIAEVTMLGSTLTAFHLEYKLDTGNGYGDWRNLSLAKVGGSGTIGNYTFNVADATGIEVGDYAFGTNVGGNAKVVSIAGNTVTVDEPNLGTVSGYIRFNQIRNEVVGSVGVFMKVRITTKIAIATAITSISIYTDTDDASRARLYPLDLTTLKVQNVVPGSRVQVYNVTTSTELANTVAAGTDWSLAYLAGQEASPGDVIRIRLTNYAGATAYKEFQTIGIASATNWSVLASQVPDTVYNGIGIDGASVTEFFADYVNSEVDVNAAAGLSSVDRLYAWWTYNLSTAEGVRKWFGGLTAEDAANFKVNAGTLDLKLNNNRSNGVQFLGDLRLYRDDGAMPVVSNTTGGGSIVLSSGKVYATAGGGGGGGSSALTPAQAAQLANVASTVPNLALEATAQAIKSNTNLIPAAL